MVPGHDPVKGKAAVVAACDSSADIYEFGDGRVTTITSYAVELES